MSEQQLVLEFHAAHHRGANMEPLLQRIQKEFPRSYVLAYYAGVHYERSGETARAESFFRKSIEIEPLFVPPYFNLCTRLVAQGDLEEGEAIFKRIYECKTLDPTSGTRIKRYELQDNLRIVSILAPAFARAHRNDKAERYLTDAVKHLRAVDTLHYVHVECWKNFSICLAGIYMVDRAAKAEAILREALPKAVHPRAKATVPAGGDALLLKLDKELVQFLIRAQHYTRTPHPLPVSVDEIFQRGAAAVAASTPPVLPPLEPGERIRVGYLSPDLNKNAVGLFCTPLLKHYDPARFEVFCYNVNASRDAFSDVLASYPGVHWVDAGKWTDAALADRMRNMDRLHVLVDLAVHSVGNRFEVVSLRPAPIIINYLGCPSSSFSRCITHRLTDAVCDPTPAHASEERLLLPRCFLCYHLFENVHAPAILPKTPRDGRVFVGIFNKSQKFDPKLLEMWVALFHRKKNLVLVIKTAEGYWGVPSALAALPEEQRIVLPFTERLEDYLDQFNMVDICIDTFPYSGTTTTCSALLMGVPVYTVYDPAHRHVSNVSASLLKAVGEPADPFIAPSLESYIARIARATCADGTPSAREARRQRFLAAMEPLRFMGEFEAVLSALVR
jgi:tetratricopeptide (TPR) repeat protein